MSRKRHGGLSRADFVFLLTSLGLLLAIVPLLVGCAMDSSRQVHCLNNMRNIGTGVYQKSKRSRFTAACVS